ncbi:D-sedoheptulose-7-phosphate isomerase [Geothermobacter hydrogeniphilus]|uniref:Phosphoheptose isomerase n=1 Tax=Geothermobacter hydrogeniphilus TaxID=1969733 RepID=A0A1X0Y1P1_9BACT|nr:D-sedoheptulose 7-phosphate isomerase [Geothermobacter hydrogeniphilus]ORJ59036.1 phosphoheptose isomerase [Geothermobacter hydrogeniphilus]
MATETDDPFRSHLTLHHQALMSVGQDLVPLIHQAVEMIVTCLEDDGKLLIMGNGGSAADAQHFAAELVGRYRAERDGLPAIALTTDSSILTAVGNDYGFEQVFARQVAALARPEDLVVVLSTSGNSGNVVAAVRTANEIGCRSIGLLGRDGGALRDLVDLPLTVPVESTAVVQEMHILLIHLLCEAVDHHDFERRERS